MNINMKSLELLYKITYYNEMKTHWSEKNIFIKKDIVIKLRYRLVIWG